MNRDKLMYIQAVMERRRIKQSMRNVCSKHKQFAMRGILVATAVIIIAERAAFGDASC